MVTVICEKSGIQFEAATKRTKNHPQIMAWVNDAAKEGWYTLALQTIKTSRENGATTSAQFITDLRQAEATFKEQSNAVYAAKVQREREEKEARRQRYQDRQYTNNILYGSGYRWVNYGFKDEEEADAFGLIGPKYEYLQRPDWHLYSSDNREVSIRQAMQEMTDKGNIQAKIWIEEHK